MLKYGLLALILGCFTLGCGGGLKEEKIVVPPNAIIDSVKNTLEIFAKTGKLTSGITSVESGINGIGVSDPALAGKLKPVLEQLQAAQSPKDVKARAQEMLDMLP